MFAASGKKMSGTARFIKAFKNETRKKEGKAFSAFCFRHSQQHTCVIIFPFWFYYSPQAHKSQITYHKRSTFSNVAACPRRTPSASKTSHTMHLDIKKRLPVEETRTPL
jgi:hypothetical protein